MAICVRRLIEEHPNQLGNKRIALVAENNMPAGDETSPTTIGNLYDVLLILFSQARTNLRERQKKLEKTRPDDDRLEAYFELAYSFFQELRARFEELDAFFSARSTRAVVKGYRTEGGSILYRPVGLHIFATVVARLTRGMPFAEAVGLAARLPRALEDAPFVGLVWDASSNTINRFSKLTVVELLLHMLGRSSRDADELPARHRRETGDPKLELPPSVA